MKRETMTKEIERLEAAGGRLAFWYDMPQMGEYGEFNMRVYARSGMQAADIDVVNGIVVRESFACKVTELMRSFLRLVAIAYADDMAKNFAY